MNQSYWAYALEAGTATTKAYVLYREATTVKATPLTGSPCSLQLQEALHSMEDPEAKNKQNLKDKTTKEPKET